MEVPTLNGDRVSLNLTDEIVKPNTVKKIGGKGLPNPKEPSRRGDLLVAFEIIFPDRLSPGTKEALKGLLPNK